MKKLSLITLLLSLTFSLHSSENNPVQQYLQDASTNYIPQLKESILTLDDKIIELLKQFSNVCQFEINRNTPLSKRKELTQEMRSIIIPLKDNIHKSNLTNKELTNHFSLLSTMPSLNTIKKNIFKKTKKTEEKIITQEIITEELDQWLQWLEKNESEIDKKIQLKAFEDKVISFVKYVLIIIIGCYAYKKNEKISILYFLYLYYSFIQHDF